MCALLSLCFIVTGCSALFNGKIYFSSNRFEGKDWRDNSGLCVLIGSGVKNLYRYLKSPCASFDGKKLIATTNEDNKTIVLVNLENASMKKYPMGRYAGSGNWFPNSSKIAYIASDGPVRNIYTYDFETGKEEKITNYTEEMRTIYSLSISPDGKNIVYDIRRTSKVGSGRFIKILNLKTNKEQILPFNGHHATWSPRGNTIALIGAHEEDGKSDRKILVRLYNVSKGTFKTLEKEGGEKAYLTTLDLVYSPDGRKIAYVRNEMNGRHTLWTMNSDGTNHRKILDDGYEILNINWSK